MALCDVTPKLLAEAKEVAFAKWLPVWRALTGVFYRVHGVDRKPRGKVGEAT